MTEVTQLHNTIEPDDPQSTAERSERSMSRAHAENVGFKQKLVHEIRRLVAIFIYLAIFFLVFRFYTRLVLSEYQINYFEYGLTILKAWCWPRSC